MANFNLDDYVPVSQRLAKFWEEYPEGRITTKMIGWDFATGYMVMQASVFRNIDDAEPTATGHAHEVRDDPKSFVNKTSFVENCETSAIGRALAVMGYDIVGGLASREEMEKVQRMQGIQQGIRSLNDGTAPGFEAYSPAAQMQPPQDQGAVVVGDRAADVVTVRQLQMLRDLAPERNLDLDIWTLQQVDSMPDELTKTQASKLIETLMAMPKVMPAANQAPAAVTGGWATKAQINAIAAIAESHGVSVTALIQQDFGEIEDPSNLSKNQASHLISTYGTKTRE